jgi:predicted DNA-binding transcriptional regulator AlpA
MQNPIKVLITRAELCERWSISRATSYRLEKAGRLPAPVHLGPGCIRFDLRAVEAMEASFVDGGER